MFPFLASDCKLFYPNSAQKENGYAYWEARKAVDSVKGLRITKATGGRDNIVDKWKKKRQICREPPFPNVKIIHTKDVWKSK